MFHSFKLTVERRGRTQTRNNTGANIYLITILRRSKLMQSSRIDNPIRDSLPILRVVGDLRQRALGSTSHSHSASNNLTRSVNVWFVWCPSCPFNLPLTCFWLVTTPMSAQHGSKWLVSGVISSRSCCLNKWRKAKRLSTRCYAALVWIWLRFFRFLEHLNDGRRLNIWPFYEKSACVETTFFLGSCCGG